MTSKELYIYCIDQAAAIVEQVDEDQLHAPTPDTEWDVRMLLNHMLYELAWAADVVAGKTLEEVGDDYDGDLLGKDFRKSWLSYELATKQSVNTASQDTVVHLSYGNRSLDDYLLEAGNDELVHAWDLGQAIGVDVEFDAQVAQTLYDEALRKRDSNAASGLFAQPVDVPESADIQTKLLALLGRSTDWHRESTSKK